MRAKLEAELSRILDLVGIARGDTVFVHAGIGSLPQLIGGGISVSDALTAFHSVLAQMVGAEGTIAAPGFFYDYARKGKPFVVETSPPDRALGFYPMHLFKMQECRRSLNPIASVLAVGAQADKICAHTSAYAFGVTSPWARLTELRAKSLVIGIPFMMTFLHHVEALVGPPHIYNKLFRVPVIKNGSPIELPVVAAVRFLDFDIAYNDDRLEQALLDAGICQQHSFSGVNVQVTPFVDMQDLLAQELASDTSFTLAEPPKFRHGELPDDGPKADPKAGPEDTADGT